MSLAVAETPSFDTDRAEAFAARVGEILDTGAIAVMLSLGHRTGLLDLMAQLPPSTSERIAEEAALAERYVREWLAVMTTGRVVIYDPARRTYRLPPEHAASLTRAGTLGNLAVYAQYVALMGQVQERTLACFETGEGRRYEDFPDFHQMMAEDSAQTVVAPLCETLLPLAEGLPERLGAGIAVLDAGCGRGQALLAMARRYPRSRFTGYDLGDDAIAHATAAARDTGLDNVRFAVRDLTHFDEVERYDLITSFDAVHDQRDPQDLLRRLCRALRPGGLYLMQDIGGSAHLEKNLDFPMASLLYAISCVHCTPVSIGQGGAGLGTMWGWETAEAMLAEAGFVEVTRHRLAHDPMNVWFVSRKGPSRDRAA
ncbi:class I SAM-dependent methyltransferase [Thiococcus pfennigii]|uniref:class I SAM-dependent methyltransferase n=1 Tax=Thiococcus pfennigii TaxID=1057 RepID=UPI001904F7E4|nr:methyltransferase domain-containing protein [Thiococcus pfennigii]MBK1702277.1 transcriptional regulator [Thiococcus pfennigii]